MATQSGVRVLLSNDDGYQAPGLRTLWARLRQLHHVDVVAPDRDRSGASNSLTLTSPLRVLAREHGFLAVEGTPADCVHLAVTGLLDHEPDIVVSGINAGPNLGDDVIYSGTVAAAMEGRHLGLSAIAVSLASFTPVHFDAAAVAVERILDASSAWPLPPQTVLNVNVPDLPWSDIKGMRSTRLGSRHRAEPLVEASDPRGGVVYWVGPAGPEQDAGEGTDFHAVREGYVSVTPLHTDLTRHETGGPLATWLKDIQF